MAVTALLLAAVMSAMLPGSPVATPLHLWLVEKPVGWAMRQSPRKLALLAIGVFVIAVLAISSPELIPLMGALGDTAMLDVLLAVWLASMAGSLRGAWRRAIDLASLLARIARRVMLVRRRARPRDRRRSGDQPPAQPDDTREEPVWSPAFA